MDKILKTILITSIAVFGFWFLPSTFAQAANLEVQFEQSPLFSETNFLPGQSVSRWVKVTNNSGQSQRIATEAINYPGFISGTPRPHSIPSSDLSRALSIVIREKAGRDLYGGSTSQKYLYDFYQNGETYLSDIPDGRGGIKEYEFEITFPFEKENEWQGATTTFDILIGFQGVGGLVIPGGGVGLPPGLTIQYEREFYIGTTTVTITWTTSYFSTSQVIYDVLPGKFNLNAGPPNYGYTYSKEGDDSGLEKVTAHSVTITGLTYGTTYYYRTVSHASLAISQERSFTTLGAKVKEKVEEEIKEEITPPGEKIPPAEAIPPEEEIPPEEVVLAPTGEEEVEKPEEFITEGAAPTEEGIVTVPPEERAPGEGLTSLFLASLGTIGETPWMAIVVVFCIIGLVVIGIREWELARKKKKSIS
jgi:hypothetical protein